MKALILIAVIIAAFIQQTAFGQDTIYVSHNKITAVQFPAAINGPVTSNGNLIAITKQDNILALKAAGVGFQETNFSIKTSDGQSYKFPVAFSYGRAGRFKTISLNTIAAPSRRKPSAYDLAESLVGTNKISSVASDKHHSVKSQIGDITISGDNLFYKLKIRNRSNINFDVDFIRFYVRDLKTAKRTVTQEQEIYPLYTHGTDNHTIEGKSSALYVFALSKFPLAKDKALFVEVYERDGARHQYLKITQRDIERAKASK
ncbi:DUF4138 domain-containing protein [Paradesertivirga mongoliensis]|uniref:DUF4138 domain-containing protein n=1 Tax=Paradesertivirga mongoliensis TaxID=2100740 RepID=A0ABW4ZS57_9SPHI|nr:DUF4138 domain-containing protein [Pedobacter mongoliensis]